ncbi:hypothetical protein D6833_04915 [Candidatus Parcubacteria bacterium]|nr:MAG: hypothetical protein D6833_04915 [Candidatus Parcubacteria bacterium]
MSKEHALKTVEVGGGVALPDFLKKHTDVKVSGTEDMGSDFTTPRIQLAQDMSPQVKKRDPEYIEGLEPGMFFHGVSRAVIGEQFTSPILKIWNSRTLFGEEGEVACWSPDMVHGSADPFACEGCPFSEWKDNNPPECKTFQNHLVVLDGAPAILSIRLSNKQATREARQIRTQAKLLEAHGAGLYAFQFTFTSKLVKNAAGQSFFVVTAVPVGPVQSEEEYLAYKAMAEQFANINTPPANFGRKEE